MDREKIQEPYFRHVPKNSAVEEKKEQADYSIGFHPRLVVVGIITAAMLAIWFDNRESAPPEPQSSNRYTEDTIIPGNTSEKVQKILSPKKAMVKSRDSKTK